VRGTRLFCLGFRLGGLQSTNRRVYPLVVSKIFSWITFQFVRVDFSEEFEAFWEDSGEIFERIGNLVDADL
jgi:hypothetical protein